MPVFAGQAAREPVFLEQAGVVDVLEVEADRGVRRVAGGADEASRRSVQKVAEVAPVARRVAGGGAERGEVLVGFSTNGARQDSLSHLLVQVLSGEWNKFVENVKPLHT